MSKILFCLLFFVSQVTEAQCTKRVSLLGVGQPAPCTGYLFSPDAEAEARFNAEEAEYYKDLSEKQAKLSKLLQEDIDIKNENIKTLETLIGDIEHQNNIEKYTWGAAGVILTYLIMNSVKH